MRSTASALRPAISAIGHVQALFSRPACEYDVAAEAVEPDDGAEFQAPVPDGNGAPAEGARAECAATKTAQAECAATETAQAECSATETAQVDCAAAESAPAARLEALQQLTRRQLELIGEDSNREGLRDTPARVAKALSYLTDGYRLDVHQVVGDAIFENEHRGTVLVRDIEMYSLCEHHLLPMFGRVHVAYVPDGKIIGLSKVARIVDVFARRLQVQERLTKQIAEAMEAVLRPRAVAVLIDASHMCMMMRGVEKQSSSTVTTAFRGSFLNDREAREELYRLLRNRD